MTSQCALKIGQADKIAGKIGIGNHNYSVVNGEAPPPRYLRLTLPFFFYSFSLIAAFTVLVKSLGTTAAERVHDVWPTLPPRN